MRRDDLDLSQGRILAASRLEGWDSPLQQEIAAASMTDHGRAREKAVAPCVIRMVMGIDNVPDRNTKFVLDELPHAECLVRQRERIDHYSPLRPRHNAGGYQGINLTLEPEHVLGNTLAMHATTSGEISLYIAHGSGKVKLSR